MNGFHRRIPIVLGTKPKPSKDFSAVLLNDDRVLVVRGNSGSSECFWFLEVSKSHAYMFQMLLSSRFLFLMSKPFAEFVDDSFYLCMKRINRKTA